MIKLGSSKDDWEQCRSSSQNVEDKRKKLLFHNVVKLTLLKKTDKALSWNEMRLRAGPHAWFIMLEKRIAPMMKILSMRHLSANQYGFRIGSDCILARARLWYNANRRGLKVIAN